MNQLHAVLFFLDKHHQVLHNLVGRTRLCALGFIYQELCLVKFQKLQCPMDSGIMLVVNSISWKFANGWRLVSVLGDREKKPRNLFRSMSVCQGTIIVGVIGLMSLQCAELLQTLGLRTR